MWGIWGKSPLRGKRAATPGPTGRAGVLGPRFWASFFFFPYGNTIPILYYSRQKSDRYMYSILQTSRRHQISVNGFDPPS